MEPQPLGAEEQGNRGRGPRTLRSTPHTCRTAYLAFRVRDRIRLKLLTTRTAWISTCLKRALARICRRRRARLPIPDPWSTDRASPGVTVCTALVAASRAHDERLARDLLPTYTRLMCARICALPLVSRTASLLFRILALERRVQSQHAARAQDFADTSICAGPRAHRRRHRRQQALRVSASGMDGS
jgi:hypothetical protein